MDMELVTPEESKLLNKLRDAITDLELPDAKKADKDLVRWLRARRYNLGAAEEMIRQYHHWYYKEIDMDNLIYTKDPPGWGTSEFEFRFCGTDKCNNPVFYVPLGKWDLKTALIRGGSKTRNEFILYGSRINERFYRIASKLSSDKPWMGQFVGIYDFSGLTFGQCTFYDGVQTALEGIRIFDAYYPEMLRAAFAVNVPLAFQLFYKITRAAIDERTAAKLIIIGSDVNEQREEISKIVDPSQFPKKYGGEAEGYAKMMI